MIHFYTASIYFNFNIIFYLGLITENNFYNNININNNNRFRGVQINTPINLLSKWMVKHEGQTALARVTAFTHRLHVCRLHTSTVQYLPDLWMFISAAQYMRSKWTMLLCNWATRCFTFKGQCQSYLFDMSTSRPAA